MMDVDLRDLDVFAAVARHRSFRRAAAQRKVSASTLSQTIRNLEARLNVRLFHRTTRSVALTEAGARLLDRIGPALADIGEAVDRLHASDGQPAGTLRINAPQPAIELVLAPLIGPFLKAHPKVRMEVVAESSLIDIVEAGYDAGVRWGESLPRDMIAVPLGPEQRFSVVAAPSLLAEYGQPQRPEDLLDQPCIRQKFSSGLVPDWEFERDGKVLRLNPTGPLVSTNVDLQHQAALDGLGYWATFEGYVAADLAAGRLVSVLEDWCPSFPGPLLYFSSRRQMPAALRAFIDFARSSMGEGALRR